MDRKRTTSEKKNMRFKEFTNIDSLRHAKVDEKPVKFFNGDYKELDISPPPKNSSKETLAELQTIKEFMSNRTSGIEDSVGNINNSSIEEIIQNDAAKKLRASMLGRCSLPSVCKTCQAKPVKRQSADKVNTALA